MEVAVIVGILSLIGNIAVAAISYVGNRKGAREANDANAKLVVYRLQQLEAKVETHNKLIERTYKLEGRMDEVEHDIRDIKKGA